MECCVSSVNCNVVAGRWQAIDGYLLKCGKRSLDSPGRDWSGLHAFVLLLAAELLHSLRPRPIRHCEMPAAIETLDASSSFPPGHPATLIADPASTAQSAVSPIQNATPAPLPLPHPGACLARPSSFLNLEIMLASVPIQVPLTVPRRADRRRSIE